MFSVQTGMKEALMCYCHKDGKYKRQRQSRKIFQSQLVYFYGTGN